MTFRLLSKPLTSANLYRSQVKLSPVLVRSYSAAPVNNTASNTTTNATTTNTTTNTTNTNNADKKSESEATEVIKTETETTETEKETKTVKKETKEHGYEFGAHHWNLERASAIALIPMLSTSFIYGAHPISDGLLGIVLPYHIYMGFDSCITDYVPKRIYPRLHRASNWANGISTGLVMWGCYEFNTNDIGMTEFMQRLFAA